MAIRYYDRALTEKIKGWVKDPNLLVLSPNDSTRLFQIKADELNDKPITLPMIALSRDSDVEILSTGRRPLTYDGATLEGDEKTSKVLNAIPIKITYQLDIYTRHLAEADEYLRNFIFNFINYPRLGIEIPYNNSKVEHYSTVLLASTVTDNSSITERLVSGQFTRMTIKLIIDDAYLFSIPFMENWRVSDVEISEFNDIPNSLDFGLVEPGPEPGTLNIL